MFADEAERGGAHGRESKRAGNMPGSMANQRIHRGSVPHEITILLAGGIEAGVEHSVGERGREHPDVLGQPGVEGEDKFCRRDAALGAPGLKMRRHA